MAPDGSPHSSHEQPTRRVFANLEPGRVPFPRAALVALGVLAAVEFAAVRQDWFWAHYGSNLANDIELRTQEQVPAGPPPSIVLLGSSRLQEDIGPRLLEQHLALPPGSVYNLAMPSGTPFDALTTYRQARAKLRQARLVIMGLDDFHTNGESEVTARDHRHVTLPEACHDYDPSQRWGMVMSALWRTAGARDPCEGLLRACERKGRAPFSPAVTW